MAIAHTGGRRRFRFRPRRHGLRYLVLAAAVIAVVAGTALVLQSRTTSGETASPPVTDEYQPFDPRYAVSNAEPASGLETTDVGFVLRRQPLAGVIAAPVDGFDQAEALRHLSVEPAATPAPAFDIWDFKEGRQTPPDASTPARTFDIWDFKERVLAPPDAAASDPGCLSRRLDDARSPVSLFRGDDGGAIPASPSSCSVDAGHGSTRYGSKLAASRLGCRA